MVAEDFLQAPALTHAGQPHQHVIAVAASDLVIIGAENNLRGSVIPFQRLAAAVQVDGGHPAALLACLDIPCGISGVIGEGHTADLRETAALPGNQPGFRVLGDYLAHPVFQSFVQNGRGDLLKGQGIAKRQHVDAIAHCYVAPPDGGTHAAAVFQSHNGQIFVGAVLVGVACQQFLCPLSHGICNEVAQIDLTDPGNIAAADPAAPQGCPGIADDRLQLARVGGHQLVCQSGHCRVWAAGLESGLCVDELTGHGIGALVHCHADLPDIFGTAAGLLNQNTALRLCF